MGDSTEVAVKTYTTPTCPYCAMAKDFLRQRKIAFEEINVAGDRERAIEMINKSGQMGVPVLDIGGTVIVGFNKEAIKKSAEDRGVGCTT
ncbi:MAG: glutaredoxin domain-containing protein [Candidatus Hodarchaeaceae archaeon]|nr:glutaredoxin domain-containing protein [Candidatus Hodarchaeaceae archaeon]